MKKVDPNLIVKNDQYSYYRI